MFAGHLEENMGPGRWGNSDRVTQLALDSRPCSKSFGRACSQGTAQRTTPECRMTPCANYSLCRLLRRRTEPSDSPTQVADPARLPSFSPRPTSRSESTHTSMTQMSATHNINYFADVVLPKPLISQLKFAFCRPLSCAIRFLQPTTQMSLIFTQIITQGTIVELTASL